MGKKREPEMNSEEMEISRIRTPRKGEVLCLIDTMLGGDRMRARCTDGNERICRIPGRLRKRVWMRPGDVILVKPWEVQGTERGDVAFRYTGTQANWLKRKGLLKEIVSD